VVQLRLAGTSCICLLKRINLHFRIACRGVSSRLGLYEESAVTSFARSAEVRALYLRGSKTLSWQPGKKGGVSEGSEDGNGCITLRVLLTLRLLRFRLRTLNNRSEQLVGPAAWINPSPSTKIGWQFQN